MTLTLNFLLIRLLLFPAPKLAYQISVTHHVRDKNSLLLAAPDEALSDIVIPNIFDFTSSIKEEEDSRIWVPQTACLSFRPLCLSISQGYYVNLLKFKGGGILGRHRHSSPVHALTLKGSWGYEEHDWHAYQGTYIFEPPGETHTLIVDEDCEEMIALFHVTGSLLYVDATGHNVVGFDDVFTKLEKAKKWYSECGLGGEYVDQFVR
jgi:quercetin dioxygenase-like cupin family protein